MEFVPNVLIAVAAQWLILVPAAFVAVVVIARRRWKSDGIAAIAASAVTIGAVKIAGACFSEPRPFAVEGIVPLVSHAPDNAFPSDHLAACGLAFAYLWPRSKPLALATLAIAVAIAAARVAARLHWPVDVLAGFLLGFAATATVQWTLTKFRASL